MRVLVDSIAVRLFISIQSFIPELCLHRDIVEIEAEHTREIFERDLVTSCTDNTKLCSCF